MNIGLLGLLRTLLCGLALPLIQTLCVGGGDAVVLVVELRLASSEALAFLASVVMFAINGCEAGFGFFADDVILRAGCVTFRLGLFIRALAACPIFSLCIDFVVQILDLFVGYHHPIFGLPNVLVALKDALSMAVVSTPCTCQAATKDIVFFFHGCK